MIWYDNLYLGRGCAKRAGRIQYKITNRLAHKPVYLVALPFAGSGILELFSSALLFQEAYTTDEMRVVGIGSDKNEACEIVCAIIDEVYRAQHNFDVATYLGDCDWQRSESEA